MARTVEYRGKIYPLRPIVEPSGDGQKIHVCWDSEPFFRVTFGSTSIQGCPLQWVRFDRDGNELARGTEGSSATPDDVAEEFRAAALEALSRWPQSWPTEDAYIRFGRLPRGNSRNQATGENENGVSCYEAQADLVRRVYRLTGDGLAGAAIEAAAGGYNRVALLITGECIGYGSDGEPLLRRKGIKIIGELTYSIKREGFALKA